MKKAIITGATSGIGRQLAVLLASEGYLVGVTGRRKECLEELKGMLPSHILISCFDVTDTLKAVEKLDDLAARMGGVDLLIISSGVGYFNEQLDFALEKKTIEVNVTGFTAVADWAYNFFRKQKAGQLVGITSIAGIRGSRHAPAYNATKAFQINYLEGLRQKAKKEEMSIVITDIRPGFVDTEMAKGEGIFWMASTEKASKQIVAAIKSRKAVAYITRRWRIISTLLKLLPRQLYQRI